MDPLFPLTSIFLIFIGGEALVSCGLMESLLKVIEWHGEEDCVTVRKNVIYPIHLFIPFPFMSFFFALMVSPVLISFNISTVRKTMLKKMSTVSLVAACNHNHVPNLVTAET